MPTTADGLGGFVAITRDITRQKQEQEQLDALANTDALTGLANRRAFDNRLRLLTEGTGDRAAPLSLLMIDADKFKLYNEHLWPCRRRCLPQGDRWRGHAERFAPGRLRCPVRR